MWRDCSTNPTEAQNMPYILQCLPSLSHNPLIPSPLFSVPFSISISQASTPLLSFSFCSLAIDAVLQPGFTSKPPLPTPRWRSADPQVTFFSPYMFHTLPSQLPWKPGSIKDQWARIGSAPGPLPSPPQALSHPTSCQLHTHHILPFTQPALRDPMPKSHPPTDKNAEPCICIQSWWFTNFCGEIFKNVLVISHAI